MSSKDFLKEIRGLDLAELRSRAVTLAQEIMKLRFRKASGQLEHSHRLKQAKRNLARVLSQTSVVRGNQGSNKA